MALCRERLINGFEHDMIFTGEVVQLAVQVKPSDVSEIIKKMQYKAVGLRLHQNQNKIVLTPNKLYPVQKLPKYIKTPKDACRYNASQPFNYNDTLAFISANDNIVSFTACHAISDGGYIGNLLRSLSSKHTFNCDEPDESNPNITFPIQFTEAFGSIIDNYKQQNLKLETFPNNELITRLNWATKPIENFDPKTKAGYIELINPASDYLCYDKTTQKTKSFTDIQWSSLILATEAFNRNHNNSYNNFHNKMIGCSTCIDLRQFIPKNIASTIHNFGNFFTCGNIICRDFSPDMTLKEMAQSLRKFYTEMKTNGLIYETLYSMYDGYPKFVDDSIPFGMVQTSNLGPLLIEEPIIDFWVQQSMPAIYTDFCACLLSYGIKGKDRNDIVMRLRYSPRTIREDHATLIAKLTRHIMTHIPQSETVENAMKELDKFQRGQE